MASVTFDHVGKVFTDGTRAVSSLSLSVGDGEFMVFVGPSGCGKTTALRMVAGLEEVTEGAISIGDAVVNDLDARSRDVAMVFQNYALYPHMNVEQNMAFGLRSRKVPRREARGRVREIARVLDLEELLERKPGQLSGGQRQRVAMGRAIVRDPKVFLMDEPLSNLDAKLRVQMRAEISRIQRELGATTIYVTHDQVEAMTMGDRVALMRKGELKQVDTPQRIYDCPVNLFAASFIGSPAMNFIQARVVERDGSLECELEGSRISTRDDPSVLAAYNGRTVALGMRPEHLHLADGESSCRIAGAVVLTEALGSKLLVHVDVAGATVATEEVLEGLVDGDTADVKALHSEGTVRLVAELEPDIGVGVGERIELEPDLRHLHFFDLSSGRAIRQEPSARTAAEATVGARGAGAH